MKCKSCGAEISSRTGHCDYCGSDNVVTVDDIRDRFYTNGEIKIEYKEVVLPSYRRPDGTIPRPLIQHQRIITITEIV